MNCKACGYPLWNLPGRNCPECGQPFKPSDFTLNPNSVRFLCPHCRQDYYGTDDNGHLVPRAFDCVRCSAPIAMDDMILLPAHGVAESMTRSRRDEPNPWLRRRELGGSRAGWRTLGRVFAKPATLMDPPPGARARIRASLTFALAVVGVASLISAAPFGLAMLIGAPSASGAGFFALSIGVMAGALLTMALLSGLIAHLVMLVTGGAPGGIARSVEGAFYSAGAYIGAAVPCLGYHLLPLCLIWAGVAHGLMLRRVHDASAVRSIIAGLAAPLIAMVLVVVGFVVLVTSVTPRAGLAVARPPTISASTTGAALAFYELGHRAWPSHAVELIADDMIEASQLTDPWASPNGLLLPGVTRAAFDALTPDQVDALTADAIASLPPDVIAHRVGDFVFTYHGLPSIASVRPDAWTLVWAPHPDAGARSQPTPGAGAVAVVRTADGSQQTFSRPAAFAAALHAENAARAADALPPLPDLLNFDWVATRSAPGSAPLPDFTP